MIAPRELLNTYRVQIDLGDGSVLRPAVSNSSYSAVVMASSDYMAVANALFAANWDFDGIKEIHVTLLKEPGDEA